MDAVPYLLYCPHTAECTPQHTHTVRCLDTSEEVARITLSLYLPLITRCHICKVKPESPDSRVAADWQNAPRHYIVAKQKAKAGIED
jgi:hypothetical protein